MHHIDPDHFLATPDGRTDSPEAARAAWEAAYAALAARLATLGSSGRLYIVCGLQGAGKSTWIRRHGPGLGDNAVCFDGALPSRRHRARALALAAAAGTPATAVWINVPLDVAQRRNASRAAGERIPDATIRHVLAQLEPPATDEGFGTVIEIGVDGLPRGA